MRVEKNAQGAWAFDNGKNLMTMACHHHAHLPGFSACGGCYARAVETLSKLAAEGVPLAQQFIAAVKAEVKNE